MYSQVFNSLSHITFISSSGCAYDIQKVMAVVSHQSFTHSFMYTMCTFITVSVSYRFKGILGMQMVRSMSGNALLFTPTPQPWQLISCTNGLKSKNSLQKGTVV